MKLKKIFFIFIFLLLFSFLIIKNTFAADKIMDGISDTTENIYSSNSTFTCGSTLTDSRDKKTYATIQVGNTCWLKSNLNYGTTCNYECFIKASKYCYGNTDSNCNVYGGLYDYEQAKSACPTGWSLPTDDDWNVINTKDNLNRINFQHFGEYLSNYQQLNTYGFYWSNIGTNYYKGISDSNLATHSVSMKEGRRLSVKCVKNK